MDFQFNRKNSPELAPGLPSEEEFEKPWVSQVQDSSKIPRQLAAGSFINKIKRLKRMAYGYKDVGI